MMSKLEAVKRALRLLSPAERDRLEALLAGRSVRSGLGEPKPRPKVTPWSDGYGNQTAWGAMKPRDVLQPRREWVL